MSNLYAVPSQTAVEVPFMASRSDDHEVDEDYISVPPLAAISHPSDPRTHNAVYTYRRAAVISGSIE